MNYFSFVFETNGEEKEYKLRITTGIIKAINKKLGVPIEQALKAIEDIGITDVITIILWGGLQKYHEDMTMEKVYNLRDELIDIGYTDGKILNDILLEVLSVSGFFQKTT